MASKIRKLTKKRENLVGRLKEIKRTTSTTISAIIIVILLFLYMLLLHMQGEPVDQLSYGQITAAVIISAVIGIIYIPLELQRIRTLKEEIADVDEQIQDWEQRQQEV